MARLEPMIVEVKVNIKWSALLKLLLKRAIARREKVTIQELIERDRKCTLGK